jgi:hypothetical protein
MEFKELKGLKEKLKQKKTTASVSEEAREKTTAPKKFGGNVDPNQFRRTGTSSAIRGSARSDDLTQKLKAAFHEKPPEDKELQRRKELDSTVRGFRKSFREEVRTGVKQEVKQLGQGVAVEVRHLGEGMVTEVKQTITSIKDVAKTKRKEKDDEEIQAQ